jgi:hypothetical protein
MDEARRFIRYVFPGLSSLFFFVLFCVLSNPSRVEGWLEKVSGDGAASIGAAIAVFVASGAIGYLVSVVHHLLYWSVYIRAPRCGLFTDLRCTLTDAVARGELALIDQANGQAVTKDAVSRLSIDGAWILVNSIWHFRKGEERGLELAEHRGTTLFDIMHGAGALLVGCASAAIVWAIVESRADWTCRSTLVLGCALLLCAALAYNLRLTARMATVVAGNILSNYFAERKKVKQQPLLVIAEKGLFS